MRRTAARKVTNGPPFDDEATKKKLAFVLGRWFDSHFPTAKAHLAICLVGEPRIGEAQVTQTEGVVQASNTVQIETMAGQLLATISAAPHACIDELKSQLCSLIGESVHNQHLFVSGSDEELSGTDPLPAGTDKLILVRSEPIMAFFGATGGTQWRNTKKSRLGLCGPGKKHWGSAAPMGKWAGVRHVAGEGVLALALPYNNLRGQFSLRQNRASTVRACNKLLRTGIMTQTSWVICSCGRSFAAERLEWFPELEGIVVTK